MLVIKIILFELFCILVASASEKVGEFFRNKQRNKFHALSFTMQSSNNYPLSLLSSQRRDSAWGFYRHIMKRLFRHNL